LRSLSASSYKFQARDFLGFLFCLTMKSRIHIDQHAIRANNKNGTQLPVISVKTYKSNTKCHEVEINGPSKLVYSPDKPLSCGARVWIETEAEVITK
jgi:hypothetical protein